MAGKWLPQCASASRCCRAWKTKVDQSARLLMAQSAAQKRFSWASLTTTTTRAYDMFEPVWSCESRERLPASMGDGPKWMCGMPEVAVSNRPCLVYSFGSNGDTKFETAVKTAAPRCDIHTFDPTLGNGGKRQAVRVAEKQGILTFHNLGVADKDGYIRHIDMARQTEPALVAQLESDPATKEAIYASHPAHSLQSVMHSLGHANRTVDIFKCDIEGWEHKVFHGGALRGGVGQMQLEVHGRNYALIARTMRRLQRLAPPLFEGGQRLGLRRKHMLRDGLCQCGASLSLVPIDAPVVRLNPCERREAKGVVRQRQRRRWSGGGGGVRQSRRWRWVELPRPRRWTGVDRWWWQRWRHGASPAGGRAGGLHGRGVRDVASRRTFLQLARGVSFSRPTELMAPGGGAPRGLAGPEREGANRMPSHAHNAWPTWPSMQAKTSKKSIKTAESQHKNGLK